MRDLRTYRDYRAYLKDYYREMKSQVSGYSYACFARKAGLSSPNYLKLVMDGDRGLTTANIQAFGKALGLSGEQIPYFEALVLENQATTAPERRYYRLRLSEFRKGQGEATIARRRSVPGLDDLMGLAVGLCAQGKTLEQAVAAAARELDVPASDARAALQRQIAEGSWVIEEAGALKPVDPHVMMSDPKGLSERQRRFLLNGLDEARGVFARRYPQGAAKFLSLLMTAEVGSLDAIFAGMRTAAEQAAVRHDPPSEDPAALYRVQVQVYRLKRNEP